MSENQTAGERAFSIGKTDLQGRWRVSVAPMMDWTDRFEKLNQINTLDGFVLAHVALVLHQAAALAPPHWVKVGPVAR